jgi:hypothetical protein
MTSIINAATGGVTFTGGTTAELAIQAGGSTAAAFNTNGLFFRNRIINGDMRIDQRNAGANVTLSGSANYPVDRFVVYTSSGSSNTGARSTTVPTNFKNSLLVTVGTGAAPVAASYNQIGQIIEGFNVADLGYGAAGALTTTLSFWVRASITGTYCVALANASTAGTRRSYIAEYSISSANTWEYKTVTIAGDTSGTWTTDNGQGLQVWFDIGSGSNYQSTANAWGNGAYFRTSSQTNLIATNGATFYITGVQLETGSVATPFERRPYGTELMLCQRYYQTVSSVPAVAYSTTAVFAGGTFPVPMRASPTVGATGVLNYQGDGVINATESSVTVPFNYANSESLYTAFGNFTGLTQSRTLFLGITVNNNNKLTLSAEL